MFSENPMRSCLMVSSAPNIRLMTFSQWARYLLELSWFKRWELFLVRTAKNVLFRVADDLKHIKYY